MSAPIIEPVIQIINPAPIIPHGPTTTGDAVTTEIHQKTMESLNDRNRAALFGEFLLYFFLSSFFLFRANPFLVKIFRVL